MNSIFQKRPWIKYVAGGFVITLGVLVIILASLWLQHLQNVVNIVVASSCLIMGLIILFSFFLSETHKLFTMTMLFSALLFTVGVALLVCRFGLKFTIDIKILVYILAIFILSFALVTLCKSISLIYFKEKVIWIILMISLTVICITLGVLSIVFANNLVRAACITLGVSLIVVGILLIVFSIMNDKKKEEVAQQ